MRHSLKWMLLSLALASPMLSASSVLDTIQTTVPALKDVYAGDFTIGCLLSYRHVALPSDPVVPGQSAAVDPNGGYLIKYHMNSMSPGNNMKPENTLNIAGSAAAYTAAATQAQKDSVDVHPIVRFVPDMIAQLNWAQRQGFTFRGHTLIWHNQTPAAFFYSGYSTSNARLSKAAMTERMSNYMKEVVRILHEGWPGLLSAMDVVNEAVSDAGGDRTTSEWYVTFGDNSYILKAFELMRQHTVFYGETQMKLYYNDYNTHVAAKADGIVTLCTPIFQAGYLDGIGMQDHDNLSTPTAAQWIASYNKFAPVCTEIAVTELDVSTSSGTNNPSAPILATQANQYGQLFKCFVERSYRSGRGKVINVSKDGLNDAATFVTNQSTSLWNTLNQCKPAFYAVVNVGRSYNQLDSLIDHANTLQQTAYSPGSWAALTLALTTATAARDQNYSASISADTALGAAKTSLQGAIAGLVTGVDQNDLDPAEFALSQNFPNPFNPTTRISYAVPAEGHVSLKVYDVLGQEVAVLYEGVQGAGVHTAVFDARSLPSGVYLCNFRVGAFTQTRQMLLLR